MNFCLRARSKQQAFVVFCNKCKVLGETVTFSILLCHFDAAKFYPFY